MVTKGDKDTLCIWHSFVFGDDYFVNLKREGKVISLPESEIDAVIEILGELKADIRHDRDRRQQRRRQRGGEVEIEGVNPIFEPLMYDGVLDA